MVVATVGQENDRRVGHHKMTETPKARRPSSRFQRLGKRGRRSRYKLLFREGIVLVDRRPNGFARTIEWRFGALDEPWNGKVNGLKKFSP
jgi:hypothetical protein